MHDPGKNLLPNELELVCTRPPEWNGDPDNAGNQEGAAAFSFGKATASSFLYQDAGWPKERAGKLNVAAYIRVSTDGTDQENSYETQERYFSRMIQTHPDWVPAGVYSDYGISGTVREKRVGFRRLLRHCGEDRIDRVVCKSISRFSRNTADFLLALETLRQHHVTILFEKENLDTAEPVSAFILTALAAIAQEESRSISGNLMLGNQMRFPRGDVKNIALYGYCYNGRWVTTESGYQYRDMDVVEAEAAVVRRIFQAAADGTSYRAIARALNREGIPAPETAAGGARRQNARKGQLNGALEEGWTGRTIAQMVQRERYTGAVLLQKKYTVDFLNHTVRRNQGELPQYRVEEHHPAIIRPELFEQVRQMREARAARRAKPSPKAVRPFSGRLLCGTCGRFFWGKEQGTGTVWFCPTAESGNGMAVCHAEKLHEAQIVRAFRRAILERFWLPVQPLDGPGQNDPAECFLTQMLRRLEAAQQLDAVERDRAAYRQELATLAADSSRRKVLEAQLTRREAYWAELENDYAQREQTIAWMQGLPAGRKGVAQFLDGMATVHGRAFVLSATVYAPGHYVFHWVDDTRTELVLSGAAERPAGVRGEKEERK